MLIYKGKPLTIVTAEMLVRTITDFKYLPPKGSDARKIWASINWAPHDIWNYMNEYVKDRPR